MNEFKQVWSHLRASFWFVPSLIVAFSIILRTIRSWDAAGFILGHSFKQQQNQQSHEA